MDMGSWEDYKASKGVRLAARVQTSQLQYCASFSYTILAGTDESSCKIKSHKAL